MMCHLNNYTWLSRAVYFEMRAGINQSVFFVCVMAVAGGGAHVCVVLQNITTSRPLLSVGRLVSCQHWDEKWKLHGKADTKTIVCLSVTVRKPTALWFLSCTHPLILKYPQLVTGHSWGQGIDSLGTDNGSAMSNIYSHGPDYRKEFHQFEATCINKTSRERVEVNFQTAAMDRT